MLKNATLSPLSKIRTIEIIETKKIIKKFLFSLLFEPDINIKAMINGKNLETKLPIINSLPKKLLNRN